MLKIIDMSYQKLQDYAVKSNWRQRHAAMTPLFATQASQSVMDVDDSVDGVRATQDVQQFTQTQEAGDNIRTDILNILVNIYNVCLILHVYIHLYSVVVSALLRINPLSGGDEEMQSTTIIIHWHIASNCPHDCPCRILLASSFDTKCMLANLRKCDARHVKMRS